jgi:hypothetical protein
MQIVRLWESGLTDEKTESNWLPKGAQKLTDKEQEDREETHKHGGSMVQSE